MKELPTVAPSKVRPTDIAGLPHSKQPLARSKIRHPLVVPRLLESATAYPRRQDPQAVVVPIDRRIHGFRSDHFRYLNLDLKCQIPISRLRHVKAGSHPTVCSSASVLPSLMGRNDVDAAGDLRRAVIFGYLLVPACAAPFSPPVASNVG